MASNAFAGVGTQFKRESSTSSGVFVALAEIMTIDGVSMSRDDIDVTNLDSTGGYREYIPGFRDGGTVDLDMNFTFDAYQTVLADFESSTVQTYQIALSDASGTTLTFDGYFNALSASVAADTQVMAKATVKVTGAVTLAS